MFTLKKPNLFVFFIGFSITLTIGNVFIHYKIYEGSKQRYISKVKSTNDLVTHELFRMQTFATDELRKHYDAITKGTGSHAEIQQILQQSAYQGNGLVRFIWADDHNILQLSSHTQHLMEHTDITNYPFVDKARQNTGTLMISHAFRHPVEALNRKIITFSMGVIHPRHHGYFGTLLATIDLKKLEELLMPLLADCQCHYAITSPHGEVLWSNNADITPAPSFEQPPQFHATAAPQSEILGQLWAEYISKLSFSLLISYALIAAAYLLVKQKIIKPVSRALALMVPPAAAASSPVYSADHDAIGRLMQLAEHYRNMQQRLEQQETLIADFTQTLSQLNHQHLRFVRASGDEMQAVYQSIKGYADHLEERILSQQLDPDAMYDYDDVREMGDNLQRLAASYNLFTAPPESAKMELADPQRIMRKSLLLLEPMLERRNMHYSLTCKRDVWIAQPAATVWLSALSASLLYAAIRHAEDEAHLTITLAAHGERVHLILSVSQFAQRLLPHEAQDFSMFMPSLHQDMRPFMLELIKAHANVMVAEAISAQLGGELTLSSNANAPHSYHFKASVPEQLSAIS